MSSVNAKINLRSQMISSKLISETKHFGEDSATTKGKYFKSNISILCNRVLYGLI